MRPEVELVELTLAGRAEHVIDTGQHTLFRHHRVHLRLQTRCGAARAWLDSGPAPATARIAGGAIHASREPAQPQHVREVVSRRSTSFFTRRSPQFNAFGFARYTDRAELLEQIDRPIPAVGRFDHHRRRLAASAITAANSNGSFSIRCDREPLTRQH